MSFDLASNPHSGCFVVSATQADELSQQPLPREGFVGPLETAATLTVLHRYPVMKPSLEHWRFLQGGAWSSLLPQLPQHLPTRPHECSDAAIVPCPRCPHAQPTILWRLTEREVTSRYRGSLLGWGWTLLTPLLMLAVYTFVFSTVFKARWPDLQEAGPIGFAINLFAGLIVYSLFSECIGKAPTLVLSQPSYVTKVIFPLELLSAVAVGQRPSTPAQAWWCWGCSN